MTQSGAHGKRCWLTCRAVSSVRGAIGGAAYRLTLVLGSPCIGLQRLLERLVEYGELVRPLAAPVLRRAINLAVQPTWQPRCAIAGSCARSRAPTCSPGHATPDPAIMSMMITPRPLLHTKAAEQVAHLARFWVGTTFIGGSVIGRRHALRHRSRVGQFTRTHREIEPLSD